MLLFYLLLICGVSVSMVFSKSPSKMTYDLEEAEALFEKFILDYDKQYEHKMEKQMRFEIFKTNLQMINELNMDLEEPVHGITKFVDLRPKELNRYKGYRYKETGQTCDTVNLDEITMGAAPDSFDWRDKKVVTPVKDQAMCGSCWAFSTTGNVEGQYAIKHNQLVNLSEQQLVDCDKQDLGCNGGLMTSAINYLMNKGSEESLNYPYSGTQVSCKYNKTLVKVNVTGCQQFKNFTEDQLKEILYKYGPISIAVCANSFQFYTKGILKDCVAHEVNHGVLLVGYGTENGTAFWIIKNSWSADYGEKGYVRVKRGVNACNLTNGITVTSTVA